MAGDSNYYDHDMYHPHAAVDANQSTMRSTTTPTYDRAKEQQHCQDEDEDEDDGSRGTRSVEWTTHEATTTPFPCCRNE